MGARIPTTLLIALGSAAEVPAPLQLFGTQIFEALAVNLPAYRRALEPGQDLARAWALLTIQQLSWACLSYAQFKEPAFRAAQLTVASEVIARFLQEFN